MDGETATLADLRDELGYAEWSSPQDAEALLKAIIGKYMPVLDAAFVAPAAAPDSGWRDIASAPKDRFIFVFCAEDNSRWIAKWQGGLWYGVDEHGLTREGRSAGDPDIVTGWAVNLWQPFPAPPAAAAPPPPDAKHTDWPTALAALAPEAAPDALVGELVKALEEVQDRLKEIGFLHPPADDFLHNKTCPDCQLRARIDSALARAKDNGHG